MKHLSILILLVFFVNTVIIAQEDEQKISAVKTKSGNLENSGTKDRLMINLLSYEGWIQDVEGLKTVKFSYGFGLYFMYDIQFGKSNFSFAPGIGVSGSNVYTNMALDDSNDSIGTVFVPITEDYKRYKVNVGHFDIPLELRFRTKPNKNNKSFKLAIGAKGGIRFSSKTKLVFKNENDEKKIHKVKNFKDISLFRFGPTFRIGYGNINLFTYYGVVGLFKKDEGPDINTYSVGISITGL